MTTRKITFAAVVGALYAVLTLALAPVSYGPVQFRISEALCVLPFFFPASSWGLLVGCVIANLYSSYGVIDIVFGSLATFSAALMTAYIGKRGGGVISKLLACLPPVLMNGVIIGGVIAWSTAPGAFWEALAVNGGTVALGEAAVMLCIGFPLLVLLPRTGVYKYLSENYMR